MAKSPSVYAQRVADGLYEYGTIHTTWRTVTQCGNLALDGFQFWSGYPIRERRDRRGYAPTMRIAQQLMDEL